MCPGLRCVDGAGLTQIANYRDMGTGPRAPAQHAPVSEVKSELKGMTHLTSGQIILGV